jgi:hypothetical protein
VCQTGTKPRILVGFISMLIKSLAHEHFSMLKMKIHL